MNAPRRHPRVWVREEGGGLLVRFEGGFSTEDVESIKLIPGRRWDRPSLTWRLPDTPQARMALGAAFDGRLHMLPARGPAAQDAEAPGTEPADDARSRAGAAILPAASSSPSNPPAADGDDSPPAPPAPPEPANVLETIRTHVRRRGYSPRTEKAYLGWARRFLDFAGGEGTGADELDATHAQVFLDHLATQGKLAPRSRNQAAAALAFLFREVLGRDDMAEVERAKGPHRLPLVLTHREVLQLLRELPGKYFLVAVLLYSAGLRIQECLRLRVKDIDFELRQILIRDGKGAKDRYVPLATRAAEILGAQLRRVARRHRLDRKAGNGWAALPGALHRKAPEAGFEFGWQFIFPAATLTQDPTTGRSGRWHLHPSSVQRAVRKAVRNSGLAKRATCHTLRHSFATEALRGGCDIRTLQHVMGHQDIRTTMIYLHVVEQTGHHIRSPIDRPDDPVELTRPGVADRPYDADPLGRPGEEEGLQWDLAKQQWGRGEGKAP